ncbi:immunoglobulin kappa light chain-like isoform X2 [Ornithorhynchus anatinus]|uniref:immunoglobulin kappa light chain-like isoform X2 n=1 Tax=Ornithorhynchus anatinus TaxID=9258 RepID=UPI0019D4BD9B|nr:immunoglobulin kappa light chain-like isoform X2 [Ornithorhynchus anatinus]
MSPLCVLALAALCAAGTRAVKVEQTELSITKVPGKTVRMSCVVSGVTFSDAFIHWYQQKPGQGLERLLSILSESDIFYEVGVDKNRFEVDKKAKFSTSTLTIHRVEIGDAATYYCGCWDTTAWIKYFGGGTKLVVTGGTVTPKAPEPIKFFPSSLEQEKQNTETYICLLKDFYPEIIRMHWKEEGSDKILESQQSEPLQVKDKYWQLSWLTVNKSSPGKIYRLIYKHEKTGRIAKEELFTAPASVPTTTSTEASTTIETSVPTTTATERPTTVETLHPTLTPTVGKVCTNDLEKQRRVKQVFQSVNMTAYYTYTILLLKSTMYCTFMLFLIYKRNVASGNWRELASSHLWRMVRGRTEFPWTKRPTSLQTNTQGAEQYMDA